MTAHNQNDRPVKAPVLDSIRRKISRAVRQGLNEWTVAVSLENTRAAEDRILLVLRFMERIVQAVQPNAMNGEGMGYACYRWKAETTMGSSLRLTEMRISNDALSTGDTTEHGVESPYFAVLKSGRSICDEEQLILFGWLPDLEPQREVILLFELRIDPSVSVLTRELGELIEPNYETLLTGFRSADYQAEKKAFFAGLERQVPDQALATTGERLAYLELWRSCLQESMEEGFGMTVGFDRWMKPLVRPVSMDTAEQDFMVASYLNCLTYLANEGDTQARKSLSKALKPMIPGIGDVLIAFARGPVFVAGSKAERTWNAVAQAASLIDEVPEQVKARLYQWLQSEPLSTDVRSAHRLRVRFSILEVEASDLLAESRFVEESRAIEVIRCAQELSEPLRLLLRMVVQDCDGYVELSSRWLDAWFGLRWLDSDVLPTDNVNFYQPSRAVEIVKCWACYARYLLNFFVLRHSSTTSGVRLPELPSEPARDAVQSAQLQLICDWAHQIGVPRALPLHSWLKRTYETEVALYSLSGKGSHRQHLFHVQDECLLGCVLLLSSWKGREEKTLLDLLADSSGIGQSELLCNWMVAALLHDLGYALKVVSRGLEALPESMVEGLGTLVADIQDRLKQAPSRVADFDPTPTRASGKLESSNHAHVSMAAVVSHLSSLGDQWHTASTYNPAAAAIIDHDSGDAPIDYATDPLSAMIVLCDQLQDWGRVRLDASSLARSFLAGMRRAPGEKMGLVRIEELFTSSRLVVKADVDDRCNLLHHSTGDALAMFFLLDGPRAGDGGYEPASAWLDVCRAFQRIRLSEPCSLPEFHVILQHRISEDGVSELHRMSRFAHKNNERNGAILDWLDRIGNVSLIPYGRGEPHEAFRQIIGSGVDDSFEWVTYLIPRLNNKEDRPLKGLPVGLYRSFRRFRMESAYK